MSSSAYYVVHASYPHLPPPAPLRALLPPQRMDQMQHSEGRNDTYWFAPIVADAEAGFGGNLNAYEVGPPGLIRAVTLYWQTAGAPLTLACVLRASNRSCIPSLPHGKSVAAAQFPLCICMYQNVAMRLLPFESPRKPPAARGMSNDSIPWCD